MLLLSVSHLVKEKSQSRNSYVQCTIRHRFHYLSILLLEESHRNMVCVLIYVYKYIASNLEMFWFKSTSKCVMSSVKQHICCRFKY